MVFRYVKADGTRSADGFMTQEQARDGAVQDGAGMTKSQYFRTPEEKRNMLWALLARSGWSIRYLP